VTKCTGVQTDFSEAFGNLSTVYTKRTGSASVNKIVAYGRAGDGESRKAVAVANQRIAAYNASKLAQGIERPIGKAEDQPDRREDESVEKRNTTWSYPAHVPHGYRDDAKRPSSRAKKAALATGIQLRVINKFAGPYGARDNANQVSDGHAHLEQGRDLYAPTNGVSYSPKLGRILASPGLHCIDSPTSLISHMASTLGWGASYMHDSPSDTPCSSVLDACPPVGVSALHDDGEFASSNLTASLSAIAAVAASVSQSLGPPAGLAGAGSEPHIRVGGLSYVASHGHTYTSQGTSLLKKRDNNHVAKLRASMSAGRLMSRNGRSTTN